MLTHGSSLAAVMMPKKKIESLVFFASHVDSPGLKVKPVPFWEKRSMGLIQVEPYGHPILSSWIGRPLCLTGSFWTKGKKGIEQHYIDPTTSLTGVIPHLAIHLDRTVNEKGHIVDPYKDLHVVLSPAGGVESFQSLLKAKGDILFHDLSFVPIEKPSFVGTEKEILVSPRLDNLLSVFSLQQLIDEEIVSDHTAFVFLFYNHEEVGSCTDEGAESRLFLDALNVLLPKDPLAAFECKKESAIFSLDMSHAFHPFHEDSADPRHTPEMGKGVVFKVSVDQKYSGGWQASAAFLDTMKQKDIPIQMYSTKNGLKSGSTVGPLLSSSLGIPALDIGIGVLGMHASYEVAACSDVHSLIHALKEYCKNK